MGAYVRSFPSHFHADCVHLCLMMLVTIYVTKSVVYLSPSWR